MEKLWVEGGHRLSGILRIQGAKNASLPIMAGCILNSSATRLLDCPCIRDVEVSLQILRGLGIAAERRDDGVLVDSSGMTGCEIPDDLMREMRSSIVFLGAIIAKMGRARLSMPGGCELGPRPIDLHIKSLAKMGVTIRQEHGVIDCLSDGLRGAQIYLDFPSVGATENIMLAAVLAKGETVIINAAKEPEIVDLQNFLKAMGAKVTGAGGHIITIQGVRSLHGATYRIMPDRIVAATYLAAACLTRSDITLTNIDSNTLSAIISLLREMGSTIEVQEDVLYYRAPKVAKAIGTVRTMPYPGFPTDAQSPLMAACTTARGSSMFVENIFESRYKQVGELRRMGADITVDGNVAVVRGVKRLMGAPLAAMDLRGGASLVAAALAAEGVSEIENIQYIDRGYEAIEDKLSLLGAKIKRVKTICQPDDSQ